MQTSPFKAPLLSKRQRELAETIERLTRDRGYPPSLREVAAAMDVSFGRIGQLARSTQAKGAIAREPGIARSWRVVKPAPSAPPRRR
jgi:repressor LexA